MKVSYGHPLSTYDAFNANELRDLSVTLWPWPLTFKSCYVSRVMWSTPFLHCPKITVRIFISIMWTSSNTYFWNDEFTYSIPEKQIRACFFFSSVSLICGKMFLVRYAWRTETIKSLFAHTVNFWKIKSNIELSPSTFLVPKLCSLGLNCVWYNTH